MRRLRLVTRSPVHALGSQFNGLEYLRVAGAPAQVSSQGLPNLGLGRSWIIGQQRSGAEQHTWRAITALSGAQFGEGELQRVQITVLGQAFYRLYFLPLYLDWQNQAGQLWLAVYQYRAGTAFAQLAAVLGTGQAQLFTQHFQEGPVDGRPDFLFFAIYVQGN
jgi:hypothetical protein